MVYSTSGDASMLYTKWSDSIDDTTLSYSRLFDLWILQCSVLIMPVLVLVLACACVPVCAHVCMPVCVCEISGSLPIRIDPVFMAVGR